MPETRPAKRSRDPEAPLRRNLPRNITGMLLFELTWGLGIPFGLYVSMVPAYLNAMGTSKSLMGFVQSFWTILIPLQLIGSHYLRGKERVRTVITLYMVATGVRLLYDVLAVFAPGLWTPASYSGLFILACGTYVGLLIIGQSIYMGVLTDNIPRRRRGWIFGLRSLFMGVGGVLTGLGTSAVLHHWASPLNFRISFMICDAVWTLSCLSLFLIRDRPARAARAARRRADGFLPSLAGKLRILLANPNYRIFLFFHMLNCVALTMATFIVPYARERLGVPDSFTTWLSVIYLASSAALGSLMGRLADKAGYRSVGAVQSFLLTVFFMIAVVSRSFTAVCIAYVLYSIVNMSSAFMLVNMSVELCPSIGGTDLTALGGTLLLPFVAVSSPLAGLIIDRSGSYPSVFYIGATIAVIALFGFAFLVREPRTGKLYEFKQISVG
jgi:MFS family permease